MKLLTVLLLLTSIQGGPQFEPSPKQAEPSPPCLDINTASKDELLSWGGMTPEIADTLIKGRPYKTVSDVREKMPKQVWDKNRTNLCLPRPTNTQGIQVISGTRIDKVKFEAKQNEDVKPAPPLPPPPLPPVSQPPPPQPLPKETIEERFRKLLEEAQNVK
ncbi:MAG TPA: hypothetical protein VFR18_03315 [Terriglobia bacterium]|nr:hypothetical protein [Terriglobia bacterium]